MVAPDKIEPHHRRIERFNAGRYVELMPIIALLSMQPPPTSTHIRSDTTRHTQEAASTGLRICLFPYLPPPKDVAVVAKVSLFHGGSGGSGE